MDAIHRYKLFLFYKILCIVFVLFGDHRISFSQSFSDESQNYFVDSLGNIFVNQQIDFYLFVSPENDSQNKVLFESQSLKDEISFDRHGVHSIVHRDPVTNKQSVFEVFADGLAPKTGLKFLKGLTLKYENRYYCQDSAVFVFDAIDKNSGIKHTFYSFDNQDFVKWNKDQMTFRESSIIKLEYYSVDNVGNKENPVKAYIYFDTESIIELEEIYFDHNSAEVNLESMKQLDVLVKSLKDFPELRILLMSHTDARGTSAYNLRLSKTRAESVKSYLTSQGIHPSRLETKGYGDTNIRNECLPEVECPEEKHKYNRRTEFKILPFKK